MDGKLKVKFFAFKKILTMFFLVVSPGRLFSEKTLGLACSSAAFIALLVGFLSGFILSKRCQQRESYLKCGHAYLEAHGVKWYVLRKSD